MAAMAHTREVDDAGLLGGRYRFAYEPRGRVGGSFDAVPPGGKLASRAVIQVRERLN